MRMTLDINLVVGIKCGKCKLLKSSNKKLILYENIFLDF